VLEGGKGKMPGLGVVVEVAEGTNVGPQVHDRHMRRVFIAGVDDETEAEVVVKAEPLGFELVFSALDGGVIDAGELAADVGEEILANFFIGNAAFTGTKDVERGLQRFVVRGG